MRRLSLARRWSVGLAAVALAGMAAIPAGLGAADHLDAPGLTPPGGDTRLDITDVYAFQSPDNSSNTVLIMGVSPLAGVLSDGTFHPDALYEFAVDTNGDAKRDLSYKVTFGVPDGDGIQDIEVRRIPGGPAVVARGTTAQTIAVAGGGMVRADVFDDPFFFDLAAFLGAYPFCEAPGGPAGSTGDDFFAGLNVSAIVLEVPSAALGSSTFGVWARTELDSQVDRMGRPAINTVFIPSASKNAFNTGKPRHDARDFSQFLGPFAGVLLPDILTVDTSSAAGFLNGRQLADDVIDIELGLIFGPGSSDCVDSNDVAFNTTFPYLADAH
jgi:hypothetical protein